MRRKKYLLGMALTFSIFMTAPTHARENLQPYQWEFAGWYGGGCYPFLLADPKHEGRLYVTSDVAGLWRSDDRAAEWYFSNRGLKHLDVVTLAVSEHDPEILYAGTRIGVERSEDGGKTWKFLPATEGKIGFERPDSYRSIVIDPKDPDKVYAGSLNGEIFSTSDGGKHWSSIQSVSAPISALYLTRDGKNLFSGSAQGLQAYDIEKKVWRKIPLQSDKNYDITASSSDEILYVACGLKVAWSKDLGATWVYSGAIPASDAEITRLSVTKDEKGNVLILAGWAHEWNGGIFLSADQGKSWENLEKNLAHDEVGDPTRSWTKGFSKPCALVFDPYDSQVIYLSDWWGIWRSDDRGKSWKERIKGAPNSVVSDVEIADNGDIFVATMDNGLLRSRDGGLSYEALCPRFPHNEEVKGHVWRVLPMDKDAEKILATNSPWSGRPNQIVFSKDAGTSFFMSANGLPAKNPTVNAVWGRGYPKAIARDPKEPGRLYLGIDGDDGGGLFISEDWGYHWTRSEGQPGSLRVYNGLVVDPTDPERIYWGAAGNENGGVYRSENGGKKWERVLSECQWVFDLAVSEAGTIYAAGAAGGPVLYFSSDQGDNWKLLKKFGDIGALEAIAINPNDPKRMAVSVVQWSGYAPGAIFFSKDGGETWEDITGNIPWGTGASSMAFSRDGYLYAGIYAGSVYKIKV